MVHHFLSFREREKEEQKGLEDCVRARRRRCGRSSLKKERGEAGGVEGKEQVWLWSVVLVRQKNGCINTFECGMGMSEYGQEVS